MLLKRRAFIEAASGLLVAAAITRKSASAVADSLAQLSASMSPGTWGRLASVANQDAVIGSQPGSSGSLITYANAAAWNPMSRSIEILGADHQGSTPNMKHVRYTESSNAFSVVNGEPVVPGIGHAYDHTVVNPFTGDIYHARYTGFTGSVPIYRKALGGSSFSTVVSLSVTDQVSHGTCWWSGSFSGAGSQGCFLLYDCGNTAGQLRAYDPLSSNVFFSTNSAAPGSAGNSYHTVLEYSKVHNVAVYGGGSLGNSSKLWRVAANRDIRAMPSTPGGTRVGIQDGNLVCDPVTGNFLLLSRGQLWQLDPTGSGSWTQQTGSRVPPSGVGDPDANEHVLSCAIPAYGVIAYITQNESSGGTFYLYKHSNSPNPPPPGSPTALSAN